jgi:hypothetical protein
LSGRGGPLAFSGARPYPTSPSRSGRVLRLPWGSPTLALLSKCLARSNKSGGLAETTKGHQQSDLAMSNLLKPIDLTDRAIRRAVFAVLDGLAAEHGATRKGNERLLRMERDKRQGERGRTDDR